MRLFAKKFLFLFCGDAIIWMGEGIHVRETQRLVFVKVD